MKQSQPTVPTSVRMPVALKERLETRSSGHFRSLNAEIVAILTAVCGGDKTRIESDKIADPSRASTLGEAA